MNTRLPSPPSEAEISAHVPAIDPVPSDVDRPFWSIMLPSYDSDEYLARALASVLEQDAGSDSMQIEVVDDGSTRGDPESLVRRLGGGRVGFHRHPRNLGATETFNTCLRRTRGRWVHILHADDEVLPGFYAAYRRIIEAREDFVMVVGPVTAIDAQGERGDLLGPTPPSGSCLLADFVRRQATRQLVQFAGWAMRRETLERVGGFCTLFHHCADWELAFRIALQGPVGCVPRPYGLYRMHAASDTRRLMRTGENVREAALAIQLNLRRLPPQQERDARGRSWRARLARDADESACTLAAAGAGDGRLAQARWAFALHPTPRRALAVTRAWLAHALVGRRARLRQRPRGARDAELTRP